MNEIATKKYNIILKIINKLLKAINKEEINDLLHFKNINREELLPHTNIKLLESMENEIFEVFNKKSLAWYSRTTSKNYVFNFLRNALCEINFKFENVNITKTRKDPNISGCIVKNHVTYSIKKF